MLPVAPSLLCRLTALRASLSAGLDAQVCASLAAPAAHGRRHAAQARGAVRRGPAAARSQPAHAGATSCGFLGLTCRTPFWWQYADASLRLACFLTLPACSLSPGGAVPFKLSEPSSWVTFCGAFTGRRVPRALSIHQRDQGLASFLAVNVPLLCGVPLVCQNTLVCIRVPFAFAFCHCTRVLIWQCVESVCRRFRFQRQPASLL